MLALSGTDAKLFATAYAATPVSSNLFAQTVQKCYCYTHSLSYFNKNTLKIKNRQQLTQLLAICAVVGQSLAPTQSCCGTQTCGSPAKIWLWCGFSYCDWLSVFSSAVLISTNTRLLTFSRLSSSSMFVFSRCAIFSM